MKMKLDNIFLLLIFLSSHLLTASTPTKSRLINFSSKTTSVNCPSTGKRQKTRSCLQRQNSEVGCHFENFNPESKSVESLRKDLRASLKSALHDTSKTAARKCHLTAGFILSSPQNIVLSYGKITQTFYSSKRHYMRNGKIKHFGLHCPVGSYTGKKSPMHHHHSERAFFTALSTPDVFRNLLTEAGINLELLEDGGTLTIVLVNKLSSCSVCHTFIGQDYSSSLCDEIKDVLFDMTGKNLHIYITHKGLKHHRNKRNENETISETYFSHSFFENNEEKKRSSKRKKPSSKEDSKRAKVTANSIRI